MHERTLIAAMMLAALHAPVLAADGEVSRAPEQPVVTGSEQAGGMATSSGDAASPSVAQSPAGAPTTGTEAATPDTGKTAETDRAEKADDTTAKSADAPASAGEPKAAGADTAVAPAGTTAAAAEASGSAAATEPGAGSEPGTATNDPASAATTSETGSQSASAPEPAGTGGVAAEAESAAAAGNASAGRDAPQADRGEAAGMQPSQVPATTEAASASPDAAPPTSIPADTRSDAPALTAAEDDADKPKAATGAAAGADSSAPAAGAATATNATPPASEGATFDPRPGESGPDPLTPAAADDSPTTAPGAPVKAPGALQAADAPDPLVLAIRERLATWPESAGAGEKSDLGALKTHYEDNAAAAIWIGRDGFTAKAQEVLAVLARAGDFGLSPDDFEAPEALAATATEADRANAEIRFGLAALKYARHARGGRINPPSLSSMLDMRPRLYEPGSLISALSATAKADEYLEGLHPRHKGFKALQAALVKLRAEGEGSGESKKDRKDAKGLEHRIVANLERWRWLPDDLGEFYIWDNVPEQYTRVFRDGKVVLQEKIVVGKPKTPTPIFHAPMKFVIFHPSWGVPPGIKSNELGPMLRRAQARQSGWLFGGGDAASRVLRRHELRVYRGGREVDPDSVNWSSVDVRQFHFTQPPSSKNVLGLVKFRFPNKHDVYMHDTSERHLFSRSQRTFSHGCMRVNNPLKLAEVILDYDQGWDRGRIDAVVRRGGTHSVTLQKNVPVYIVYFTTTADEDGKIRSHGDIYGIDSRIASALAGHSVALTSARSVAEQAASSGSSSSRSRPVQRSSSPAPQQRPRAFRPFAEAARNGGG